MLKKYKNFFIVVGIIFVILFGVKLVGNHYSFEEREVEIKSKMGNLEAVVAMPKDKTEDLGVVVFVHGDGPTNKTNSGQYEPMWEMLTKKGYACISWHKPGVKKTDGDWHFQSMEDRADEVIDVLNWARKQPEFNDEKIGLWGTSQAAWVLPKVSAKDDGIAFNILMAPSNNWLEDARYAIKQNSKKAKDNDQERAKRLADFEESVVQFAQFDNYKDYKAWAGKERALPKSKWTFRYLNYKEDVVDELDNYYSPVKVIVGSKDASVDSKKTIKIYKENVDPKLLSTTYIKGTDHYMTSTSLVKAEVRTSIIATLWPRALLCKEYYEAVDKFIDSVEK